MGKRASTFLMIAILAVLMLATLIFINRSMIFQEGNPLPVAAGICRLTVGGEPYVKIKDEPATWMTEAGESEHDELFSHIEETYGVKYTEQKDNDFIFDGEGKQVTVVFRSYSRNYRIWELKQ